MTLPYYSGKHGQTYRERQMEGLNFAEQMKVEMQCRESLLSQLDSCEERILKLWAKMEMTA